MDTPSTEQVKATLSASVEQSKAQLVQLGNVAKSSVSGIMVRDYVLNELTDHDKATIESIENLASDDPTEAKSEFYDIYKNSPEKFPRIADVEATVDKVALVTTQNFSAENFVGSESISWVKATVGAIIDSVFNDKELSFDAISQRQSELGAEKVAIKALEAGLTPEFAAELYNDKLAEDGRVAAADNAFLATLNVENENAVANNAPTLEPIEATIVRPDEIDMRSTAREAFVPSAVMASVAESLRVAEGNSATLTTPEYRENREFASESELHQLFELADTHGIAMQHAETNPLLKEYVAVRDIVAENLVQRNTEMGMLGSLPDALTVRAVTIDELQKDGKISREEYTNISQALLDDGLDDAYLLLNNSNAVAATRYSVEEVLADANGYGAITHKVAADSRVELEEARQMILDGDEDMFFTGNDKHEASKISLLNDDELEAYTAQARTTAETMLAEGVSEHPLYKALVDARDESVVEAEHYYTNYELQNTPKLVEALLADSSPLSDEQKTGLSALRDNPLDEQHLAQREDLMNVASMKIERLSPEKLAEAGISGIKMPNEVQAQAYGVTVAEVEVLEDHGREDVLAAMLPQRVTDEEAIDAAKEAVYHARTGSQDTSSKVMADEFSTLSLVESDLVEGRAKAQIGSDAPELTEEVAPAVEETPNVHAEAAPDAPIKTSAVPFNPFGPNGAEQLAMIQGAGENPLASVDAGVGKAATEHRSQEAQKGHDTQIG